MLDFIRGLDTTYRSSILSFAKKASVFAIYLIILFIIFYIGFFWVVGVGGYLSNLIFLSGNSTPFYSVFMHAMTVFLYVALIVCLLSYKRLSVSIRDRFINFKIWKQMISKNGRKL